MAKIDEIKEMILFTIIATTISLSTIFVNRVILKKIRSLRDL